MTPVSFVYLYMLYENEVNYIYSKEAKSHGFLWEVTKILQQYNKFSK